MSFYWVWIPSVILLYIVCGLWSTWANDKTDPNSFRWVWALYLLNIGGLWPWVARFSNNIVFDSLLYDLLIFFSFYCTVWYLGAASDFTRLQVMGSLLVVAGFLMLKVGGK